MQDMQDVQRHMARIMDDYKLDEDLKLLLTSCLSDQETSTLSWAKITLCVHAMLGGTSPDIYRRAAVTELIILILDIVDDLQDQDNESKPWMKVELASALNAVLALIVGMIGELGKLQASGNMLSDISTIIARSINGQHKDVTQAVSTVDAYLWMTQEKSGSLFRLACYMGYADTGCSEAVIDQLHQVADCVGLLHQIQNDVRDLVRFDEKSDLIARKRTLPILYLLSVEDEAFLPVKAYYEGQVSAAYLMKNQEKVQALIQDSGCLEYARIVQTVCVQKAEEIYADLLAQSPWKEEFRDMTVGSFMSLTMEGERA
ncbi:polyprenyl synthetase family protein [Paenibacillus roseipurpureus]|uniref:Polyprenyl synthetase family protein n=1 Tax=Paenibacillus roseopurpureus TaxID=2918901 RepID=A0AA96LNL8_9BACL|nr:polyprenyl synthetase family protein [Paenibacillus sp. MBLB1832]WNR45075.1 polyprenyl synthetase family protein [Paenibacillus sp. MBLB1832]